MFLPDDSELADARKHLEMSEEELYEELAKTDSEFAFGEDALDWGKRRFQNLNSNLREKICREPSIKDIFARPDAQVLGKADDHPDCRALDPTLHCADVRPVNPACGIQVHLGNPLAPSDFTKRLSKSSFRSRSRLNLPARFRHSGLIVLDLMVINQRIITNICRPEFNTSNESIRSVEAG
jgi:hypothetical protein